VSCSMVHHQNFALCSKGLRVLAILLFLGGCGESHAKPHSVTLTWNPSTSVVAGYNVYRTPEGGSRQKLTDHLVKGTEYVDSNVQPGHAYTYVVTSVDAKGRESRPTDPITAKVPSR